MSGSESESDQMSPTLEIAMQWSAPTEHLTETEVYKNGK